MKILVPGWRTCGRTAFLVAGVLAIGLSVRGDTPPTRRTDAARKSRHWDDCRRDGMRALEERRYPAAEQLLKQAVAEAGQIDPEGPEQAESLGCLGALYMARREYDLAEPFLTRAVAIEEKVHGPESDAVAARLNDLAIVESHRLQFDPAENWLDAAERLARRALALREKHQGPDDPATATVLNTLAYVYFGKKEYDKAEPILARALAILEKAVGPNHPEVARTLHIKALILIDQSLAKAHAAEAQDLGGGPFGVRPQAPVVKGDSKGPRTAKAADRNAEALQLQKQSVALLREAESLFERVLAIREKTQGMAHPDYLDTLFDLLRGYEWLGDRAQAQRGMQRLLACTERALGPDHREVADVLFILAEDHMNHGEFRAAVPLFERARAIQKKGIAPKTDKERFTDEFTAGELEKAVRFAEVMEDPARRPAEADLTYLNGLKDAFKTRDVPSLVQQTSLCISDPALDDAGLVHVERLTNLEDLAVFADTAVTDAGLAHLARLTSLQDLSFYRAVGLTDRGLAHLEKLSHLERLNLTAAAIRGPGLVHLRQMTSLRELILIDTPLDDEGLANLPPLPSLEEIYLQGTRISDRGIVHLKRQTGLCKVGVSRTKVTAAGLDDLKRALPEISTTIERPDVFFEIPPPPPTVGSRPPFPE